MLTDYVIRVENVTYYYPNASKPALDSVSFKLRRGEILAILGPTGAGKTTLAYCLNGTIPHFITGGRLIGDIIVCGLNTKENPIRVLAQKVSLVFDNPEIQMFGLSVFECIAFGPTNLSLSKDEIIRRVKFAIEACKLKGLEYRNPSELSYGEKQSVAIASALAMTPEVLVLDEATAILDPTSRMRIYNTIYDIAKKHNMAAILIAQETGEVLPISDKVIVLNNGRIELEGSPHEILSEYNKLKNIGLRIPQVAELYYRLGQKGIITRTVGAPITIEEAYKIIPSTLISRKGLLEKYNASLKDYSRGKKGKGKVIIRLENVHFMYPKGVKALNGVDLEIYEGEFIALTGPNGAGKTTLAKHLNGLLKPALGKVIVFGEDTKEKSVSYLSRKVGYVYQNPDLMFFNPTVRDELKYGPMNLGIPLNEINRRIEKVSKKLRLEEYLDYSPSSLPRGVKKRVALASILTMDPDVIVVDEPTTGQDWLESIQIMNILKELNREGKTVIVISHDMELIAMYANRIIIMSYGTILKDGSPRETLTDIDILNKASLRPPQITELFIKLSKLGMPKHVLTVDEAYDIMMKYCK